MNIESVSPNLTNQLHNIDSHVQHRSLAQKINKIVIEILKFAKHIVLFPTRYLGSKTCSLFGALMSIPSKIVRGTPIFIEEGYHFEVQKHLTDNELREYLKYAATCASSFNCDPKWIEGLNGLSLHQFQANDIVMDALPVGLEVKERCLFDEETGLKIVIYKNENEVIIAFGAKRSANTLLQEGHKREKVQFNQNCLGACNLLGASPAIYKKAAQAIKLLKDSSICEGKTISLTGQSLGGSLAEYVGIELGIATVCFNSLPLGAGLQVDLGSQALVKADQYITHISVENDILSDNSWFKSIDRIMSFLALRTPGNFGNRFDIPSAYSNKYEAHNYVLGSVMKHLGFDIRCLPKDVVHAESFIEILEPLLESCQIECPKLIQRIFIHSIKFSFSSGPCVNLNSYFNLEALTTNDAVHLFALLSFYKCCYETKFENKNKHIDYATRAVEQAILLKVDQNNAEKETILALIQQPIIVELFTEVQIRNFKCHLDRASGQREILYHLTSKSQTMGLTSLKAAKISSLEDHRPAVQNQKPTVLHAALEYNRGTVGGLGVVTKSLLPKQREHGHDARIITPFFSFYQDTLKDKEIKFVTFIEHEFKGKMAKSAIYKVYNGEVKDQKEVTQYLVMPNMPLNSLFDVGDVKDLYANYEHSGSSDRLLYFSSATAAFAGTFRGYKKKKMFDLLHIHGWHTGVASLLLDTYYNPMREAVGLSSIKRIFQVHLSAEQGIHLSQLYKDVGLEGSSRLVNIHADALNTSDMILYVSRAAANEAVTKEHGWGLHDIALKRYNHGKLKGITNGITHRSYDPFNRDIFGRFTLNDLENAVESKKAAKLYAYQQNVLADPVKPLFMFVGRYSSEKGIEMLPHLVSEIARRGGQTLVMGIETQDIAVSKTLAALKSMSQDEQWNLRFFSRIQEQTALVGDSGIQAGNLIRLATDISLVPSYEEACGLVPMELLSVGALVLTSQVQGLKDTCNGLGDFFSDNQQYSLENFNSFTYDNSSLKRRDSSTAAIAQTFEYLNNTPPQKKKEVVQRLIVSAKRYDWLKEGGAIQQIEEAYLQA